MQTTTKFMWFQKNFQFLKNSTNMQNDKTSLKKKNKMININILIYMAALYFSHPNFYINITNIFPMEI